MDTFWRWRERFRRLFFKRQIEQEVENEIRFHLEMETQERIAGGADPGEAQRSARIDFGAVERFRAEAREVRWGHRWDCLAQDARYALRRLAADPVFTGIALFSLALGIGASTAVFSIANAVLLRPVPYGEPENIVWIETAWEGSPSAAVSPAEFLDYRDRLADVFSAVGVYSFGSFNVGGDGEPVRVQAAGLSAETLAALGVRPAIGRSWSEEEDVTNASVVLLSDAFWRQRFAADPDVVGRTIRLDGREQEVLGVLPPGFQLPETFLSGTTSQVYGPMGIDPARVTNRGSHFLSAVARIRPGLSPQHAASAIEELAAGFSDEFPDAYPAERRFRATAVPLGQRIRGPLQTPVGVLAAAVGFVLLITCANVANLLLSRTDHREREFALRSALGAGRGRILTQVMVESILLAFLGGALGLAIAELIIRGITQLPFDVPLLATLRNNYRVLTFAGILSPLCGLLFGLVTAFGFGRPRLLAALKEGAQTSTGSLRSQRLRRGLVVAEVAVALVLLSGAGLLTRSFSQLLNVDPGFLTDNVVTTKLSLSASGYPQNADVTEFYAELVPRLAELPVVTQAGAVTNLPLATRLGDMDFEIEGREIPEGAAEPAADWQVVTPGYFEAMGLSLLRGRGISPSDTANSPGVAIINETFAALSWPGEDALGKRFRLLGENTQPELAEVIGIVRDVRHESLSQDRRPQMYFPHQQFRFWGHGRAVTSMALVIQSSLPPEELRAVIAETVHSLDADLPLAEIRTMEDVRRFSVAVPWLLMTVMAAFSFVALVLSTVGLYGVMTYAVGKRLPEFGIRLALGARPGQMSWKVLAQGARLTLLGIGLGLVGALGLTRAISGLLYDVSPTDPLILGAVSLLLALTALLACYAPALRATRVDLVELLRSE